MSEKAPISKGRGRHASGQWKTFIECRKQRGLTQEEVGVLLGHSQTTISAWERLETLPCITDLPALAEFLQVTSQNITDELNDKKFAE